MKTPVFAQQEFHLPNLPVHRPNFIQIVSQNHQHLGEGAQPQLWAMKM